MSVTFWMPQAPQVRVCPYPELDPDFWTTEPVKPFTEINVSGGNAIGLMDAIGCGRFNHEDGTYGQVEGAELDAMLERVDVWLAANPEAPWDSYLKIRLAQMHDLLSTAKEHGFYVAFG